MNYENKYKEAKKWIESIYSELSHEQQMEAEAFFPELNESYGEKIRKWLIGYFQQYRIDGMEVVYANSLKVDDILAWLEKQGNSSEQIHYWTEEEIEPIISDYLRGAEHYGGMIARLRCLKPKSLEKQGEQKSTTIDVDKMVSDYASHNEKRNEIFGKPVPCMVRAYKQGICDTLESLGEEKPFEKEFTFKAIPRLLDMIEPSDRAKAYCQKLIDTLAKEEYNTDAKIVEGVLKGWNGEDVPMAVMDEKQGEQKPILDFKAKDWYASKVDGKIHNIYNSVDRIEPKFKVGDIIINIHYKWDGKHRIREITDGKYIFDGGSYINIKEQDSWELANKVEPKFKVGDWITIKE